MIKQNRKVLLNFQAFTFTNKAKKAQRDYVIPAKKLRVQKQEESRNYDFNYKDAEEAFEMDKKLYYDKTYLKMVNHWKKNLEKKKRAKAIIKERFEHFV